MRAFVAVDVGAVGSAWPRAADHLTLRFLGEVAPARLDAAIPSLRDAAQATATFRLRLEGVGAFPSAARPRVVWQAVTEGRGEVEALAERVRAALAREFGREDEPFVPHLTLFRVRTPDDRAAADALLRGERTPPPSRDLRVSELLVKESQLSSHGAVHRTRAALPLLGGGTVG